MIHYQLHDFHRDGRWLALSALAVVPDNSILTFGLAEPGTHVMEKPGFGVRSPLDTLSQG